MQLDAYKRYQRLGKELPHRLGLTEEAIDQIPLSYREARIPKKDGRERILLIPNAQLKSIQRLILRKILCRLPIHPAAKGFRRRYCTADHAAVHSKKDFVILMDIENFFPSTSTERIVHSLLRFGWSQDMSQRVARIACQPDTGGLPQGAPTSPVLSNIVNWEMDKRLAIFSRMRGLAYSRYADDIAFSPLKAYENESGPGFIIRTVVEILSSYGYSLKAEKTRILRCSNRQTITGLVVNQSCNLPRYLRRRFVLLKIGSARGNL